MNLLVFLDAQVRELEKILSGVKTILVREFDPALQPASTVNPGDILYFLRDKGDSAVRVKAIVVRVLNLSAEAGNDLSNTLKELQPRLQLTEEQYNTWSVKQHLLLVEIKSAQKTGVIPVDLHSIMDHSNWIPFADFNQITVEKVSDEYLIFNPLCTKGDSDVYPEKGGKN